MMCNGASGFDVETLGKKRGQGYLSFTVSFDKLWGSAREATHHFTIKVRKLLTAHAPPTWNCTTGDAARQMHIARGAMKWPGAFEGRDIWSQTLEESADSE